MPDLPSGTVTFLFTDIEGSTRLWEAHPEAMRVALARHDALLREMVQTHGGHVFKAVGDAFYAVFPTAAQALAASVAGQRTLAAEPWPVPGGLRVRMAAHTGAVELRERDYFGPALNRVARLLGAGHGGQVLLSEATRALVAHDLPDGVGLRDLGVHRLPDLAHPEHVYQVVAADLPVDFPPLRTLDTLPNNLPRQLTSFVGREREIAEVRALLSQTAFATLTGTGGSGKTRLALQVAAELLPAFPDGTWLAELAAIRDPALVAQAVATAVGVREELRRPLLATLTDALRPRRLLLVLDNCEHLLAASAQIAHELLSHCPHLRVLATSQESLGVAGEVIYRVPPLSLPAGPAAASIAELEQYEAVRLFVDRAALSNPRFGLTSSSAPLVIQICRRLDGIPLAIELAAARVRVLSLEQIAARLDERFRLLTTGDRAALPRHQTLRAALDWSYDLLVPPERAVLRRLAVFAGGFDLPAAETVCAGDGVESPDVLDVMTRLVEKSLVLFEEQDDRARYRLLETVRLYGLERLTEAGEEAATRDRHRDWYLLLAMQSEPELQGPRQQEWLDRLETEHDNLRAALAWSQTAGAREAGLSLAGSLSGFWDVRGYWGEGRGWLRSLLAHSAGVDAGIRVKALNGAAWLAFLQGDYAQGVHLAEESLELARQLGDKRALARCLNILGFEACRIERYDRAAALGQESLALSRELGDGTGTAQALAVLGLVARGQRDYPQARAMLEESLARARELGNKAVVALILTNLGLVVGDQGDLAAARDVHEDTLQVFRALGDKFGIAFALSNLAIVAWRERDYRGARRHFRESLELRQELGEKRGIATCLVGLGAIAGAEGDAEGAAVLCGAAEALREAIGVPPPPFIREEYDARVAALKDALGEAPFAAAWRRGREMSLEQAITYALEAVPVEAQR